MIILTNLKLFQNLSMFILIFESNRHIMDLLILTALQINPKTNPKKKVLEQPIVISKFIT